MNEKVIKHYGIEGMRKGYRRWQYPDGRFNEAGKKRYFGKSGEKSKIESQKKYMDDIIGNYSTPHTLPDKFVFGGIIPGMIMSTVYSIELSKKNVSELISKGNDITNDILKKYGGMTFKEAYGDILKKYKYERKNVPKFEREKYSDINS